MSNNPLFKYPKYDFEYSIVLNTKVKRNLLCMKLNKESTALLQLIDDKEPIVQQAISKRIVELGHTFIPLLENYWENCIDEETQHFIENLIHKIELNTLSHEIKNWTGDGYNDLLKGSLLISKYAYPHLNESLVIQQFETLKRKIWLELNNYLTPLEKCSVLCKMLFDIEKYECTRNLNHTHDEYLLHKLLETKKGNLYAFGLLIQMLCDALDINANIIQIPGQMIIAFYHSDFYSFNLTGDHRKHIHFYLDAHTGEVVLLQDIEKFCKQYNKIELTNEHFYPMKHKDIIHCCFKAYGQSFAIDTIATRKTEVFELLKNIK
jgi:hypothetical protein